MSARPVVSVLVKRRAFRYLWLKEVRGFAPLACCAASLRGRFDPRLSFNRPAVGDPVTFKLEDGALFYLCGVHFGGYARNVHVPFEPAEGERFVFESEDLRFEVVNARRLAVPDDVEEGTPSSERQKACRNFRFASHYFAPSRASAARKAARMSAERP